jgi:hypothetical protein
MGPPLVPAEHIKLPEELNKFLDDPPLVGTERREDYESLFLSIAMDVKPVDAIAWMLVNDIVYLYWHIQRERRVKASIIKLKQKEAVAALNPVRMTRADFLCAKALAQQDAEDEPSTFKRKTPEPVKKDEDLALLLAQAYIIGDHDIDFIDRRIASYEWRRNAALREMDRHSESLARKVRDSLGVIEGEFTESE